MAKKQRELDTSIEITFKDGSIQVASSLEEASKISGLSEASLKIRCNKSRNGSASKKDKIHCKWINDTTFRSYQSKKSRNKGGALETEVVNRLKEIGFTEACRSAGESRALDNNKIDIADPSDKLPIAIQCKNYANTPNYFKIKSECPDKRDFVLIWKKAAKAGTNSPGTVVMLDIDYFFKLFEAYERN